MSFRLFVGVDAAAVVAAAAGLMPAFSAQAQPELMLEWTAENDPHGMYRFNWNNEPGGVPGSSIEFGDWTVDMNEWVWPGWRYASDAEWSNEHFSLGWNVVFNNGSPAGARMPRPFITTNIVVTNNAAFLTQNFSLLMTLPTGVLVHPLQWGSVVGTVSDMNGDGATVSAPNGSRIYTPRIDGDDEPPGFLLSYPFSQSTAPMDTANVERAEFGIPGGSISTQVVDDSMAIFLEFDLTPGDTASFTASYQYLPSPTGVPLLAVWCLVAGRRRRRVVGHRV